MSDSNRCNNKLYIQDKDGEYKELTELEFESDDEDAFTESVRKGWNTNNTLIIRPIYKLWYKKKKGKHFVRYYKIKQGLDPKIIKLLKGDKDE